ncbi:signal recognition particle receptor subunit beta, putative [Eimeria maxima]|uniref:Signal recognition particle receptor subunit beta n=1 Tax=Eimeria maxima TaxID=5804 RepID=U6ME16_EIMMA|nr:signal recognition particle receptor subunit beta, putative [Eimeria maxima]CDJ60684.1 signal recognition particle receptor subunit beta, putative [Eimeria maxima]
MQDLRIYVAIFDLKWRVWLRVLFSIKIRPRKPQQVCLLGATGSGKTSCFLALRNGKASATVPSMVENRCELSLLKLANSVGKEKKEAIIAAAYSRGVEAAAATAAAANACITRLAANDALDASIFLVDTPGHPRLRPAAAAAAAESSILIFFVDAADKPSFKAAAELLFDLFCNPKIIEKKPSLLLVVNKTDKPEARGQQAVIEDLEREIERVRVCRQASLDAEERENALVGIEGHRFILDDCPLPLCICSAAVTIGDLSAIPYFIIRHTTT